MNEKMPFGAELHIYDFTKSNCNFAKPYIWNRDKKKYFPCLVTRRGGKASKVKFNKQEYIRIANALFKANNVDEQAINVNFSDSGEIALLYEINQERGTVVFCLEKEINRFGEYIIMGYNNSGEYIGGTVWVTVRK